MKNNTFKDTMKKAIASENITITDLSKKTGIQRRRIYDYLEGIRTPDFKNKKIIEAALNIPSRRKEIPITTTELLKSLDEIRNKTTEELWKTVFENFEKCFRVQYECISMVDLETANDIIILLAKTTQEVQRMTYKSMDDQNIDNEKK